MKGHSRRFYLLTTVLILYVTAMMFRIFDAYNQGDVWLAFSRRSDVGWPMAQILALIASLILLYAVWYARTKKI